MATAASIGEGWVEDARDIATTFAGDVAVIALVAALVAGGFATHDPLT